ncbi:tetratricopeptide repeat protein [Noviherbaspirillum galbum]|uniref:Tetratricopeptide repeat protein n=1 Tax=Noviherbaspirillum galbum TaxID=2709383 RepID=A0A6B3SRG3_9BURK|nr:tetratricopeptide repeat protein [Noviherbaspirillum galbum]NEX61012.1 tetratricopeptide repeat protein [Noviherbaspirillum galbum]
MLPFSLASLDQPELMRLALHAAAIDDHAAALSLLKEAVSRPDATGPVRFLLGSIYAQLNLFDEAIAEMQAALALDPAMGVARFQLGLLLLTSGQCPRALDVLTPLADYGPSHYLTHFGAGLRLLVQNELEDAVRSLAKGISLNKDIAAMNDDMRKIIERIGVSRDLASGADAAGSPDLPRDAQDQVPAGPALRDQARSDATRTDRRTG